MEPYLIEEYNECLTFTINRPKYRNAINYEVMEGLDKFLHLGLHSNIKALIVTGAGEKAFCSGGDLSVFHQLISEDEAFQMLSKMSSILYRLLIFPKPTIAILNGSAVGGGCELASACDFRIGKKGMKAGFIQGKLAITTGWGGGSMLLEKLEASKALKLLMSANIFEDKQLLSFGFLDGLYDDGTPLENGVKFLEDMLTLEADVLTSYKNILIKKWEATNIKARMSDEVRNCAKLWETDVHHQKVASFLEKNQ
ncbi:enoyl-CoA hydratase/isomerase family protein [Pseudoneobacillus sp. C159]